MLKQLKGPLANIMRYGSSVLEAFKYSTVLLAQHNSDKNSCLLQAVAGGVLLKLPFTTIFEYLQVSLSLLNSR